MFRINTLIWILFFLIMFACSDSTTDSDPLRDGPGPAIGISAGLDPTLAPGDDFGGLAGASTSTYDSPANWQSDPENLPRFQSDSCGFLEGGLDLGTNAASEFSAQRTGPGIEAEAFNKFEVHNNNTRITIDFNVYADAQPREEYIMTGAEASLGGASPFGVETIGILYVIDIDNIIGHEAAIEIGWEINSIVGGDPYDATMDAVLMMNTIRSCGEVENLFPFDPNSEYLFYIFDESVSTTGSRNISLGRSTHSQVILSLELAVYAGAARAVRDGDGNIIFPEEYSFGNIEGSIEIKVGSR